MTRIFVYGTLKIRRIQREVLHREPYEQPMTLPGWKRLRVNLNGIYYEHIEPSKNSAVHGFVLTVTPDEKKKLDDWESEYYVPVKVKLMDGSDAYAYRFRTD